MSETPPTNTKTHLALALANGIHPAKWARDNGVPKNTAYRWAKDPLVYKAVDSYRRRTIDLAVGRMARQTSHAADVIIKISKEAESDSVRLRAARAIFSDTISVSRYSGLEVRLAALEEDRTAQADAASSPYPSRTADDYGRGAAPP